MPSRTLLYSLEQVIITATVTLTVSVTVTITITTITTTITIIAVGKHALWHSKLSHEAGDNNLHRHF